MSDPIAVSLTPTVQASVSLEVVETPVQQIHVDLHQGTPGLSAYELAVSRGFDGTLDQWLASLVIMAGAVTSVNNRVGAVMLSKNDVGLSRVSNTSDTEKLALLGSAIDTVVAEYSADPARVIQDTTHRFVSDAEKSTWNGKEDAGTATAAVAAHVSAADPHGDRANAATLYQPLSAGKGLSTNDYTTVEKTKLAGIAAGATANTASTANPLQAGTAAPGTAAPYAREDHRHPVDTSREPAIASGTVSQFLAGTKTWRDLATDVRASALTGYAIAANAPIAATDTVLGAAQKLEGDVAQNNERFGFQDLPVRYVQSDGITANRCNSAVLGVALAGWPVTMHIWLPQMTTNPAASAYAFVITATVGSLNNAVYAIVSALGTLSVLQFTDSSNYRSYGIANFRATWLATRDRQVIISIAPGTTDPVVYVLNDAGVWQVVDGTVTTTGTAPNWMAATLSSTYLVTGYNWPTGPMPHLRRLIIGTLNTAHLALLAKGVRPWWLAKRANTAAVYVTPWGASLGDFNSTRCTYTANIDGVSDGTTSKDDCLRVVIDSSAALTHYIFLSTREAYTGMLRARGWYLIPSGQTLVQSILASNNVSTASLITIGVVQGTWTFFDIAVECTDGMYRFYLASASLSANLTGNGADMIYLQGVSFYLDGTLIAPEVQCIPTTRDKSGNGIPMSLVAGCSAVCDVPDWRVEFTTSTAAPQKATGAAILGSNYASHGFVSIECFAVGTPTITVGSASGGSQYVASVTLVTGYNKLVLVTTKPGGTDIWVGSNTTDLIRWVIKGSLIA